MCRCSLGPRFSAERIDLLLLAGLGDRDHSTPARHKQSRDFRPLITPGWRLRCRHVSARCGERGMRKMTPSGAGRAWSRPGHARPGRGAHTQRTVKNGHILCGFGVPRRNPAVCASGCRRELDGVGGLVPRWVPAGWHVIGKLDCACQGVWIPRVLAGHSVGNNGTVRTGERMYGGSQCPLSANQPRLR